MRLWERLRKQHRYRTNLYGNFLYFERILLIMKIGTLTLGCKVNFYDTETMQELFLNAGYDLTDFDDFADIYLINTCTVTNLGNKKSRQMIRKAKKNNPNSIVVATGCYAQVAPEEVEKIKEVDLIIGTKDRGRIVDIVESYKANNSQRTNFVSDIMTEREYEKIFLTGKANLDNKTRAYLKIQEGCDRYCSYCIIPYARGAVRSRLPQDILTEVKNLLENNFKEIVLAGIHIASYGKDLKNINLSEILKQIHEIENLERIRFSSIDPCIVTKDFVNTVSNLPRVCNHMHLSLQSGCNKTLKNMNRKYTKEFYKEAVYLLRSKIPNIAITTDVIVGFPSETTEDFWDSYNFCEEIELSKIHVFPFSPKIGTKAYSMENQIDGIEKNKRTKLFLELNGKLQKDFLTKNLNSNQKVLYEKKINDCFEGYTTNYIPVKTQSADASEDLLNKIIDTKLVNTNGLFVDGKI